MIAKATGFVGLRSRGLITSRQSRHSEYMSPGLSRKAHNLKERNTLEQGLDVVGNLGSGVVARVPLHQVSIFVE